LLLLAAEVAEMARQSKAAEAAAADL